MMGVVVVEDDEKEWVRCGRPIIGFVEKEKRVRKELAMLILVGVDGASNACCCHRDEHVDFAHDNSFMFLFVALLSNY